MTIHELKTHMPFFQEIVQGEKTWELRRNDRGFEVGDVLHLREYDPVSSGGTYTGADAFVVVTRIRGDWNLPVGLKRGFVILDIERRYLMRANEAHMRHNS